eukprot:TRINITY_DN96681_c0_g1_i1.p1 TRINITY_DN96681_c0_g1~~TRINITY_DN96681_c0_g1_i1.p1  ORF type:complete len:255 (-),score=14.58 TRINITY_DN96681_c0_g1_i1:326-1063(-)
MQVDDQKKLAARSAVNAFIVRSPMKVGLGTGSTAKHAVDAIADKVKNDGFDITCVCTSEATETHARKLGLCTRTLEQVSTLDVAIDGADEIDPNLVLIKGGGGALLREKLVELQATKFVVIADASKIVQCLGKQFLLPVEVIKFGWECTRKRIEEAFPGVTCERRTPKGDTQPFKTDEGNYILDCNFRERGIADPQVVAQVLKTIPGVVEHGLFSFASCAHVASPSGDVKVLLPPAPTSPRSPKL